MADIPPLVPVAPSPLATDGDAQFDAKAFPFAASLNPFGESLQAIGEAAKLNAEEALAAALGGDLPPLTGKEGHILGVNNTPAPAFFGASLTATAVSSRQFSIPDQIVGMPFTLTMPAAPTGPSSMVVGEGGPELDILTPVGGQIPNDYWEAGGSVRATVFSTHVEIEPRPRYVDLDRFTAYYGADGQYSVSARIEASYDTTEKLEYVGAGVVPSPRPFEPINWNATFADRAGRITPPVRDVTPRIIANYVSDVFVELWRHGNANFASGDKAYIDLAGSAEWYPRVERRLTSDNELFGYYNPSWSAYTTPLPTGTGSANVMQAHFIDFPNDRLFTLQKDGETGLFRAYVASTGVQLSVQSVAGTPSALVHCGLHVDAQYFWAGGDETVSVPTVQRLLRSNMTRTAFEFNPALSGLPGVQANYASNVVISVDEASNKVALRVKRSGTNYILIGSWSAFKGNSAAWVADHTFIPTSSQGAEIFQGLAIKDGAVMILTGFSQRQGEKWLISYDFQGRTLDRRCLEIGRDSTDKYEPQGLNIYSDGTNEYLTAYFATGTDGANNHKLFRTTKAAL